MNAFNQIVGYESVKEELLKICDMLKNRKVYQELGASLPKGVLLYGPPGVGKSLLAKCLIQEAAIPHFILRKDTDGDHFISQIRQTFYKAQCQNHSIILLDDLDRFPRYHGSDEEFAAVQAGIETIHGTDTLVLATANEIDDFPESLLRDGRFDLKIEICEPSPEDSVAIIQHYLKGKSLSPTIDLTDISKMLAGKSCAELESLLNMASIYAGYERCDRIKQEHIIEAFLNKEYPSAGSADCVSLKTMEKFAYHEAGHVVVSELISPDGIAFASIQSSASSKLGGLVRRCNEWPSQECAVFMSLAGKAATDVRYGRSTTGASNDIEKAIDLVKTMITEDGCTGMYNIEVPWRYDLSTDTCGRLDIVIQTELNRYLSKTVELLTVNRSFLDDVASELLTKKILLNSDIRKIRERNHIVSFPLHISSIMIGKNTALSCQKVLFENTGRDCS